MKVSYLTRKPFNMHYILVRMKFRDFTVPLNEVHSLFLIRLPATILIIIYDPTSQELSPNRRLKKTETHAENPEPFSRNVRII